MKTIGLTLSGGAIRGVIHLGVIKALEEYGIQPQVITGTSMGSIIGGLYSAGMSHKEILKVVAAITPKIWDINWRGIISHLSSRRLPDGIIKGDKLEKMIDDIVGGAYMEDITMRKLGIVATNLNGGQNIIFTNDHHFRCTDEMECIRNIKMSKAIRASIGLPFIFKPVIMGDYVLVDGGIVNNCPVNVAQKLGAKFIVASDIDYNGCHMGTKVDGISILFATLDIIVKEACEDDIDDCTVPILKMNFGDIATANMFSFTKEEVNEFFNIGYMRAMESLKRLDPKILL